MFEMNLSRPESALHCSERALFRLGGPSIESERTLSMSKWVPPRDPL